MNDYSHFYIHQNFGWRSSQVEIVCDSVQPGCVLLDVVHFGDLAGAVAKEVGYLPWSEGFYRSIWLFHTVHQPSGKGVT